MQTIKSNQDKLAATWKREEQQPFAGWDFSYLDGRMFEERPPWSYASLAVARMRQASSLLDMGTGGGERLLEWQVYWPDKVAATEDYAPNVKLVLFHTTNLEFSTPCRAEN
jgi:hypothetical protein